MAKRSSYIKRPEPAPEPVNTPTPVVIVAPVYSVAPGHALTTKFGIRDVGDLVTLEMVGGDPARLDELTREGVLVFG
jgi:hypothetical protein